MVAIQQLILAAAGASAATTYYVFDDMSKNVTELTKTCASQDATNLVCLDSGLTAESNAIFATNTVAKTWTTPAAADFVYSDMSATATSGSVVCDGTKGCVNHLNVIDATSKVGQVQDPADVASLATSVPSSKNCLVQWMLGADPKSLTFPTTKGAAALDAATIQICQWQCMQDTECALWSFDAAASSANCYLQKIDAITTAMNVPLGDSACKLDSTLTTATAKIATCANDATLNMCAVASGKYISGRTVCADDTPSLAYLQTGTVCNPTTTTTSQLTEVPNTSGARSSSSIVGTAAAALIAVAVVAF